MRAQVDEVNCQKGPDLSALDPPDVKPGTAPRTFDTAYDAPEGLIARIAISRDRPSFARLFHRFSPRLRTYLTRMGLTDGAAEDVTQETLLTVWRKADQFDPKRATAAGWIFAIARNRRIDVLRRERTRGDDRVDEPACEPLSPEQELKTQEGETRLREALHELPLGQAVVLQLSYFEELSHPEIARKLGLPLGTVKSRIRRASASLREALDDLS